MSGILVTHLDKSWTRHFLKGLAKILKLISIMTGLAKILNRWLWTRQMKT